jgi:DNA-binding transcriptional MerR regulator
MMTTTEDNHDTPALRIGEVARRTGVNVATLRAWERRHGLLIPERTAGGQRLYRQADVERVLQVTRLVQEGWSVGAAATHVRRRPRSSEAPALPAAGRRPPTDPIPEGAVKVRPAETPSLSILASLGEVDPEAAVAGYTAARDILAATTPTEVRGALVRLVERLGGSLGPAAVQDDDILPVDVSCGEGDPLLPRAAPFSLARLRLEMLLPSLAEQARHRLLVLRQATGH